ncbi:MAG: hypothetical protein ACJ75I_10245 [Solirubrobacterales bacterium]
MTLFITWFLFPMVLTALSLGCGLLVERITGIDIPGVLLPAVGFALIIVVAQFFTLDGGLAELTTPVTVALAVVGFGLSLPTLERGIAWWAVAAAVAAFAVYAAPIVLSGQATFAGYIKLDDTATWMTLTDRVMEHGRSLSGLPPSTYEATLDFNLASGYPVGVFLPLGVGRALVGQDVAWVIQPYMAYMGALLALGAWSITEPLVKSPWLRALIAFLAAQSALLFGYYLWGGIKEMAAAAFVISIAGVAAFGIREWQSPRPLVPLAIMSAALIGVLSGGGGVWLAPSLVVVLVVLIRALGAREVAIRTAIFAAAVVVMCLPVIIPGGLLPPTSSPLTSATALGNLYHALNGFQLFGVWPNGDFRLDPKDLTTTYILIAVVGLAAVLGIALAVRARAWGLLMYVGGAMVASLAIFIIGSPWVGGKALATASPAIPLAAAGAGAALFGRGRHIEGGILIAVLAVGVLWSNALAYRDVSLAPRAQLAELQTIGGIIGDAGPALMTEYQPYGVRHFLRDAAPEGASELRRRKVPLLNGHGLRKGLTADVDEFELGGILTYRTLVLRRGPGGSRPPSPYQLIYKGSYYDVWQRPASSTHFVIAHLGLGTETDPAGVPKCSEVQHLARQAGPGGTLAAVSRDPVVVVPLTDTKHPAAWNSSQYESALLPRTPGTLTAQVQVPQAGDYEVYLGGSVRPEVGLSVDGEQVSSTRAFLNNFGEYVPFGDVSLSAGAHTISITFHGSDLHPASGGTVEPIGPLALADQDAADTRISYFPASQADQLCGRPWDWIEAVSGPA